MGISGEKVFKFLLYLDVLRGEHSTGAMIASKSSQNAEAPAFVEVVKTLGPATSLFEKHGKFQGKASLTSKSQILCLLGHNRYATQGGISEETAHPFEFGEVVGAHNGTVSKQSLSSLHEASLYEVDSQRIYSHLGQGHPITDVWKVADGAMALTWFNKNDEKLRLIRNGQRTLYTTQTKDKKILLWASESWMLTVACGLSKVEIEEPVLLKENLLQEISVGEEGGIEIVETAIDPFVKKVVYTSPQNGYCGIYGYDDDGWTTVHKVEKKEPFSIEFKILEIHNNKHFPKAFGKTIVDGKEVQINIPQGPRGVNILNNIKQRGNVRGFYTCSNFFKTYAGGVQGFSVHYDNCTYVKRRKSAVAKVLAPTVKGFGNVVFNLKGYEAAVSCGCLNCNEVPPFSDADSIKWVSEEDFVCGDCLSLPWIPELIEQFTQMQQQKRA